MPQIKYKSDWLGSNKYYYNTLTKKVSQNINDVIDFETFDWHPEGLKNYLDFGYSVFGQTPVKNVKFLEHDSELALENNELIITKIDNPLNLDVESTPDEALFLIKESINNWENSTTGEIIIPTSGGYDSRLLNLLVNDKERIRAFTYGISANQEESFEVVYAKELSKRLNIKWNHIEIGKFHKYLNDWDAIYGISTHAHGMYHMEFYDKITKKVEGNNPFLSGIIGDIWSGNLEVPSIKSINELKNLGYTHGLNANSSYLTFENIDSKLAEEYYETKKNILSSANGRIIESMRFKIILLNYLMNIPKYFGFKPFSPFLDQKIALSMLNLSVSDKKNRQWQVDFFEKHNLNIEAFKLNAKKSNSLNYIACLNYALTPLNLNTLKEIINPHYVEWINKNTLQRSKSRLKENMYLLKNRIPISTTSLWPKYSTFDLKAYCAYLTLYPLHQLIEKRNAYFGK